MRIDVVVPHFHPVHGGVETRVREVGRRLVDRGHRVVVHTAKVAPGGERLPEEDTVDGIEVRRYRPLFRAGYFATLFLPRIAGGDVLDLQGYPHPSGDLGARRALASAQPVVLTPHGLLYRHPDLASPWRRLYDRWIGGPTLRSASRVVLVTPAELGAARRLGVRPAAIRVIPNGVGDDAFDPVEPLPGRELGRFERYVLFLGRLHPDKAPLDLVAAFERIARDFPDAGLVFAGPDAGLARRLAPALRSGALRGDRALWLGPVPEPAKRRLLAGCTLLALPSRFEAQGIVLLEAWARSRPVVASRVGGAGALVEETGGGLLHDFGDIEALAAALGRLLGDARLAEAMGARGRAAVRRSYCWSTIAEQVEGVLAEAAAGGGG